VLPLVEVGCFLRHRTLLFYHKGTKAQRVTDKMGVP